VLKLDADRAKIKRRGFDTVISGVRPALTGLAAGAASPAQPVRDDRPAT
jgi:hypothetical protein